MSLSKKNKFKGFGIGGEEALDLLYDIIDQTKGICKSSKEEVFALILEDLTSTRKRTIHNRYVFEFKAVRIIDKSKEKINNGDYLEIVEEVLDLFRDEAKSKMRLYLDKNSNIITMAVSLMTFVVSILGIIIPLILH